MKILFVSNTFSPHVGGVARSIELFTAELRSRGLGVLTVAPTFDGMPEVDSGVVRVPAVQNFNGSDFSVAYPLTGMVSTTVEDFQPDIIHSHHPFILGATAFCIARATGTPLVFTHHTMYEQYTHYVPGDSPAMKRFAIQLGTGYANLCQHVIAPSESIRDVLQKRGVSTPISVVPTGVDCRRFTEGSGTGFRSVMGIPGDAFLIGHVGRLAPEKNLPFLAQAVTEYLLAHPNAQFLLVGCGPYKAALLAGFRRAGVAGRVHHPGPLSGRLLVSAYRAMDVFAFASHSETQGMVVTEAMAAGVPVVAVDAPGVREVVASGVNGVLMPDDSVAAFIAALDSIAMAAPERGRQLRDACLATADAFSIQQCTSRLIGIYESLASQPHRHQSDDYTAWDRAMRLAEAEWKLIRRVADAAGSAILDSEPP